MAILSESQQLARALALLEVQNIQMREMQNKIDNLEIQNRQLKGIKKNELDEIRRKADSVEKVGRRNLFPDAAFYLFPELPPEIQDCIWDFALPGPKVVSVVPRMRQFWQSLQIVDRGFNRYFTPAKHSQMPPLLRTCRASRRRALRASGFCFFPSATWNPADLIPKPPLLFSPKHSEVFASNQHNPNNMDYVAPGVRFQPAVDTIYLSGCARLLQPFASDHQGHLDTKRIESLAISAESDYNDARLFLHNMGRKDIIEHGWFNDLRELILVVRDEDIFWQNMRLGLHPKDSFPLFTDPLKAATGLLCPNLAVKVMTWRILFDYGWRVGKPSAEVPYCIIWPESEVAGPPPTTVALLDQEY